MLARVSELSSREPVEPDTAGLVRRLLRRRNLDEYLEQHLTRAAAEERVARESDRSCLLDVLDASGLRRGQVWMVRSCDELAVADLASEDPGSLDDGTRATVRELLERRAREQGARRLTATVSAGDPAAARFVAGGGFETFSTPMRLDLRRWSAEGLAEVATDDTAEDPVVLARMDETAFAAWWARQVAAYAAERERAGESSAQARQTSETQHAALLPDGLESEHHWFFVARLGARSIGSLWLGTERPTAFVYDVALAEEHRRRGHGASLMRAAAQWARRSGSPALGLDVFEHNRVARRLYDRLGYQVSETFVATTRGPRVS